MKNNSSHPSTPSNQFFARIRLSSITSPNLSPLKMNNPSPFLGESSFHNFSDDQDFNNFQLEENPAENQSPRFPHLQDHSHSFAHDGEMEEKEEEQINLNEEQRMYYAFILKHCKRDHDKIEKAKVKLEEEGPDTMKKVFDHLVGKFVKLKKTKEEMVKYCIRKSFKFITNKMRNQDKETFANMENSQVVAFYFQKHAEGDTSISLPFQKTSQEKTMNSAFLKKIFKCRQYNMDYHEFLKQFPAQLKSDNNKKVNSMSDTIKKALKGKCLKAIDEYKRLPWTYDILNKLDEFAQSLTQNSPYSKGDLYRKQQQSKILLVDQMETKVAKKNNVIILTPPLRPLADPMIIPEKEQI